MANDLSPPSQQLVTVFGGSGFVGRHVVRALVKRGYRVRVAVRRPDLAGFLQPLGTVGQIHAVQANLRYPDSVAAAIKGADAVVNLVGILQESGRQSFAGVHANGARAVAQACAALGVPRLVQISAIGASKDSKSSYGRSKAEGEAAVLALVPGAVVLRPSIMFGPEDGFFNRFAALARMLPVLPLVGGGETKFQPAFVGDVAEAIARAVDGAVAGGRIYELGGPEVKSFRELVAYICEVTGRKRLLVSLPFPLARLQARIIEIVDMLTLGLLPNELKLTRDQVALLESDNVVSHGAKAEGRDFAGLGIAPSSVEAVVPSYLWRFRKTGQFDAAQAG
ncbi:NADH dehydrogenase [Bosea sp. OK403]|uniref:complex I NDUFA9 subunit family protein n=1 Tax=Bosea sp. OK403 TaxID=1855286 RepID=UPI0008E7F23E|nr:complex I NDUFA9 subunit family protein [Bosea sp. OK403]SFI90881.1 NADH dehydrogenase [Bosea sp. OK403]